MLIAGAKGFAKELLTIFSDQQFETDWTFFDDVTPDLTPQLYNRFTILRSEQDVLQYFKAKNKRFILGVGNPSARFTLFNKLSNLGGQMTGLISARAIISKFENHFGDGVTIMPNAVVESENQIAEGVLIHVAAFISHECRIGKFSEISPAAQLLGKVTVGEFCSIGAGAIILPEVTLGNNVIVGAGAVVTKDILNGEVVVGVPAKRMQ